MQSERDTNGIPQRLRDSGDLILGRAASWLEGRFTEPPEYETVGWEEARRDVESSFGAAAGILDESALAGIEAQTRNLLAEIKSGDPFRQRWAADSMLARFCYLACRLIKPDAVVETGVAYGVSSAFILAAMEANGRGRLHSVDLRPLRRGAEHFHAIAIPDNLKDRWTFHRGSSRRMLPGLLPELGEIDFFLHDSLHTKRNMLFEFDEIWPALRPGGLILADDVERNGAFGELRRKKPSLWRVVKDREARPLHGEKAPVTFGVVVK